MSCRYISDAAWLTCLTFFNGECAYCGSSAHKLTADHVVPRSQGGSDAASNIVPACERCNEEKADQDWRDYMMTKGNFSQARMNRIFDWRRICKQARVDNKEGYDAR